MKKTAWGLVLGFILASHPAVSAAQQDPFRRGESRALPGLDSILVAATLKPTWKGYRLGAYGGRLFADIKIAGRPVTAAGNWGLSAFLAGTAVKDPLPATVSRGHWGGGLALSRFFSGGDGAVRLSAETYRLSTESEEDAQGRAGEYGLAVTGLEWDWGLEEVSPRLAGGLYRGRGKFEGTRADLSFTLAAGMQNVAPPGFRDIGVFLELYGSWSDYFSPDDAPGLDRYSWYFGGGVELDRSALAISLRLRRVDAFDAPSAAWSEFAVRIWPDAR